MLLGNEVCSFSGRGFALLTVLLVTVVLTILISQAFLMSRHDQLQSMRIEQGEIARQIAEMACDEAFAAFSAEVRKRDPEIMSWILGRNSAPRNMDTPLTTDGLPRLFKGGATPSLKTEVRLLQTDFRDRDSRGNRYYDGEGVGSLVFTTSVDPDPANPRGKAGGACVLSRIHDFKAVCLRARSDNSSARTGYVQSFPLDYALLVRQGGQEFETSSGRNLNDRNVRLTISQDRIPDIRNRGKVRLGTVGGNSERRVFLNVHEGLASGPGGLIPPPEPGAVPIDFPECAAFFPRTAAVMEAMGLDTQRPGPIRGMFRIRHLPIFREAYSSEQEKERNTVRMLSNRETGPGANVDPGAEILGSSPETFPASGVKSLLEGDIRQRFLRLVEFRLEDTGGSLPASKAKELMDATSMVCLDPGGLPADPEKRDFMDRTAELSRSQGVDLFSSLDTNHPYFPAGQGETPEVFPECPFWNRSGIRVPLEDTGKTGSFPFNHVNLWGQRMERASELITLGIIDPENHRLNLHGVHWVFEPVTIGEPGQTWKISGQGVLFSEQGFDIRADLEKENREDLGIFATRGNIKLSGSSYQASFIAMGESGKVHPSRPFRVQGALAVTRLETGTWKPGNYVLEYDRFLKSPSEDLFIANLSPAVNFFRVAEP